MVEFIVIFLIVVLLTVALARHYQPMIDVVVIGYGKHKVLLWYNHYEEREIKRRYKVLYEYKSH